MTGLRLRSVNTRFWDDPYIHKLNPNQKLLYVYLITSPFNNLAGVYEISQETIEFHTGLSSSVLNAAFEKFSRDGKVAYVKEFVIMKNFMKHQSYNHSMIVNVEKTMSSLPDEVRQTVGDLRHGVTPCGQGGGTVDAGSGESEGESEDEILKRKEKFKESIFTAEFLAKYGEEMLTAFFDYWSEMNKSGKKMKYEYQVTWEVGRRLATWFSRDTKFVKGSKSEYITYSEVLKLVDQLGKGVWDDYEAVKVEGKNLWRKKR